MCVCIGSSSTPFLGRWKIGAAHVSPSPRARMVHAMGHPVRMPNLHGDAPRRYEVVYRQFSNQLQRFFKFLCFRFILTN